jgi:hypothetical protein
VSDVAGSWTITLTDSLPCADTLVDSTIIFSVTGTQDDVEPAGSLTFASSWSMPGGLTGTAYGTLNVKSRSLLLHVTRQDTLGYALEIRGALDDNLVFHGAAIDPYQGYLPLLVTSSCTFIATGTRTGP